MIQTGSGVFVERLTIIENRNLTEIASDAQPKRFLSSMFTDL